MIACMLRNDVTHRYHPIFFRPAPMPSGADESGGALRHRSYGHSTDGFDTLEQANAYVDQACKPGSGNVAEGSIYSWDGESVPAMTLWFPLSLVALQYTSAPPTAPAVEDIEAVSVGENSAEHGGPRV